MDAATGISELLYQPFSSFYANVFVKCASYGRNRRSIQNGGGSAVRFRRRFILKCPPGQFEGKNASTAWETSVPAPISWSICHQAVRAWAQPGVI